MRKVRNEKIPTAPHPQGLCRRLEDPHSGHTDSGKLKWITANVYVLQTTGVTGAGWDNYTFCCEPQVLLCGWNIEDVCKLWEMCFWYRAISLKMRLLFEFCFQVAIYQPNSIYFICIFGFFYFNFAIHLHHIYSFCGCFYLTTRPQLTPQIEFLKLKVMRIISGHFVNIHLLLSVHQRQLGEIRNQDCL